MSQERDSKAGSETNRGLGFTNTNNNPSNQTSPFPQTAANPQPIFNSNDTISMTNSIPHQNPTSQSVNWQQQAIHQVKIETTNTSLSSGRASPASVRTTTQHSSQTVALSAANAASSAALPTPPSKQQNPTTLLDNITSQMSEEGRNEFMKLFKELQTNTLSAEDFLSAAKRLLGADQYKQLENLKGKPPSGDDRQRAMPPNISRPIPGMISQQHRPRVTQRIPDSRTPTSATFASSFPGSPHSPVQLEEVKEEVNPYWKEQETTKDIANFMDTKLLNDLLQRLAQRHGMSSVSPQCIEYLMSATQIRLRGFVRQMAVASRHRVQSQDIDPSPLDETGRPIYKVMDLQNIKNQLFALERVEREGERKRKEIIAERERQLQMGEGHGEDGLPTKKKRKQEGPGVAAKNMTEDARKQVTNDTAMMSAGGVRKSWMLTGVAKDVPRPVKSVSKPSPLSPTGGTEEANVTRGRGRPRGRKPGMAESSLKRSTSQGMMGSRPGHNPAFFLPPSSIGQPPRGSQRTRELTVSDAMFALEKEKESGQHVNRHLLQRFYGKYQK